MASKKAVSKAETYNEEKVQETVKKVGQWTPQSVAQKVTDATVAINKTFSDVSSQLQGVLKEYEEANLAVEAKKGELETVFGKERVLKSIDDLNTEHTNTKSNLQIEFDSYEQNLEAEKANIELQRQQDENQFIFDRNAKRRNDELVYQETLRVAQAAQRDADEARERAFKGREEVLTKAEQELIDLRTKALAFPEEVKKAEKTAEAIATNRITKDFTHQIELIKKDAETSGRIASSTIATLQLQLTQAQTQIGELNVKLAEANAKVQSIAEKALESASGQRTLAEMQTFAGKDNGATGKSSKA